jgi:hypothetical protein
MSATTTSPRTTATHNRDEAILFVSDPASEYVDGYLPVPVYYDKDGTEHTLKVGDVVSVQFASEEAFGYSQYEEVQVTKFNKASVNVRRLKGLGHYGTTANKRINFSKISEGEVPRYAGMYSVHATVYFVRAAAEQKVLVNEKNAAAEAHRKEQRRLSDAHALAETPKYRDNALADAERAAQGEAVQAILAKYEVEIKVLAAQKFIAKSEAVAAEFPVVEGVYVVSIGDGTGWGGAENYAFATEAEAFAHAEGTVGYVTVAGPVNL